MWPQIPQTKTNKIQLLLELIPSEVSKRGCAALRSNESPFTGAGQAYTAELPAGTVVKRAMRFSGMPLCAFAKEWFKFTDFPLTCEQNSSHFTCLTLSSSKQGQFPFIRQKDSVLWSQMRPAMGKCIFHFILGRRGNQGSGRALLASPPQHTQTQVTFTVTHTCYFGPPTPTYTPLQPPAFPRHILRFAPSPLTTF